MANFLEINGIPLSVADGSARMGAPDLVGEKHVRSYGGTLLSTLRATKEVYTFDTPPMSAADALAWRRLFVGDGHYWSFDANLYSSKGLGPNAGALASQSAGSAKFGAGKLSVNATTGTITFAAGLGSTWSVSVWRNESGTWKHYLVRSDGAKWLDGVSSVAATTWLSVSGGSVTLTETGGSPRLFDDLAAFPFLTPSTWPAYMAASASGFSALPRLVATGDFIKDGTATVLAEVGDTELMQGASGTWQQNLMRLSVTLREV